MISTRDKKQWTTVRWHKSSLDFLDERARSISLDHQSAFFWDFHTGTSAEHIFMIVNVCIMITMIPTKCKNGLKKYFEIHTSNDTALESPLFRLESWTALDVTEALGVDEITSGLGGGLDGKSLGSSRLTGISGLSTLIKEYSIELYTTVRKYKAN